jgi:superfamily II DNA helicase RecQ
MGIDKSNVQFVIHFDIPCLMTLYAQEVGQVGRDGNHLLCVLCMFCFPTSGSCTVILSFLDFFGFQNTWRWVAITTSLDMNTGMPLNHLKEQVKDLQAVIWHCLNSASKCRRFLMEQAFSNKPGVSCNDTSQICNTCILNSRQSAKTSMNDWSKGANILVERTNRHNLSKQGPGLSLQDCVDVVTIP